jgi:hypothetical protein
VCERRSNYTITHSHLRVEGALLRGGLPTARRVGGVGCAAAGLGLAGVSGCRGEW